MGRRLLLCAVLGMGCGEPLPLEEVQAAIANGVADSEGAWPGVAVTLNARDSSCSASLVDVDQAEGRALLLTAGHCVMNLLKPGGWTGLVPDTAVMGPTEMAGTFVRRAFIHPDYRVDRRPFPGDPWPLALAYDFAVLEVSGLHPQMEDWALPVWGEATPPVDVGDAITFVGYGNPNLGSRYVGENVVDALGQMEVSQSRYYRALGRTGGTPCGGDSGGAMIARIDGVPTLIGVHSSSKNGCGEPKQVVLTSDVRDAQALIEAAVEGRQLPFTTCAACAASPDTCGPTHTALLRADIDALTNCINERSVAGTFAGCSARFPAARAALDAHWACLQSTCGDLCNDAARHLTLCEYGQDGGGPCDACIVERCCDVASACMNNTACYDCANTTAPSPACRERPDFQAFYGCLAAPCQAACAPYVGALIESIFPSDGGVADGAVADGAVADGAVVDGAVADGAVADGAVADGAVADGGPQDATAPDATPTADEADEGCQTAPGGGSAGGLLLCLIGLRRRATWRIRRAVR